VESCCEYGSQPPGSIKCEKLSNAVLMASRVVFSSIELVSKSKIYPRNRSWRPLGL
jgi:hypothetical protein